MASRDQIRSLGLQLDGLLQDEPEIESHLSPKARLVRDLGRGAVSFDVLTDQQIDLVGLDRTAMQQAGRVLGPPAKAVGEALYGGLVRPPQRAIERGGEAVGRILPELAGLSKRFTEQLGFPEKPPWEEFYGPKVAKLGVSALETLLGAFGTLFSPLGAAGRGLAEAPFEGVEVMERRPTVGGRQLPSPKEVIGGVGESAGFFGAPEAVLPRARAIRNAPPVRGPEPPPAIGSMRLEEDIRKAATGELTQQPFVPLPPTKAQRALPQAPREAEVRPYQEPPPVLPGRPALFPGEDLVVRPTVEPPPRPLRTQRQVAETRAGIEPMPTEVAGPLVDPYGRPIMVPFRPRGARPEPAPTPEPPRVPEGATPAKAIKPAPAPSPQFELPPAAPGVPGPIPATWLGWQPRSKGAPLALWNLTKDVPGHAKGSTVTAETLRSLGFEPPKPSEPPPSPPKVTPAPIVPPPPAKTVTPPAAESPPMVPAGIEVPPAREITVRPPRPRRPRPNEPVISEVETVNLSDPDEVARLIRMRGGLKVPPEFRRGELEGAPPWFFNKKGVALNELAQEIADAQRRRPQDVEQQLLTTVARYSGKRRELGALSRAEDPAFGPKPDWVAASDAEWVRAGIAERRSMLKFFGAVDEAQQAEAAEVATRAAEPPPAAAKTRFEPTEAGQQGLILGASQRAIPTTRLRPERPQADITESPLFGQERAAREEAAAKSQGGLFEPPPPKAVMQGPMRTLQTPSGDAIARLKLLRDEGRGAGTYEVVEWLGGEEPMPRAFGDQTYRQWFEGRTDPRLISSVTRQTTREGGEHGYLQLTSADAKYLASAEGESPPALRSVPVREAPGGPRSRAEVQKDIQALEQTPEFKAWNAKAQRGIEAEPPHQERLMELNEELLAASERDRQAGLKRADIGPAPPPEHGPPTSVRGLLPPLPLPGPTEEEEGTSTGYAKRAGQVAGLALPVAAMGLMGRGLRMPRGPKPPAVPPEVPRGTRPPEVPPAYRSERAGPPRGPIEPPPGVSPFLAGKGAQKPAGGPSGSRVGAPPGPPGKIPTAEAALFGGNPRGDAMAEEIGRVAQEARAGRPPGGGEPPGTLGTTATTPAGVPGDPMPEVGRAARFFDRLKADVLAGLLPPEAVVKGDSIGERVVGLTYEASERGHRIARELESFARNTVRGFTKAEVDRVTQVLDTDTANLEALLSPRLAKLGRTIRASVLDAGADGTGLPRERRFANYFPKFRDTVTMEGTRMVLDPKGEPYRSFTFTGDLAKRYEAFFHRPRTTTDPPSHLGLDGLLIYQRATARHLAMNGGFHPLTGEAIPGYLNELQALLHQGQPREVFKPYLAELVNYFLGTPVSRSGTALTRQLSRILRNVEFSRLIGPNLLSPIKNTAQQINTLAHTRPTAWVQGYRDLVNPERRALARQHLGGEDLGKVDLETIQAGLTTLDRLESLTGQVAHVSGTLFRVSEIQGNRFHAFLAGLRDAEHYGLGRRSAIEYALDIVRETQFPGGGPATPRAFRGPFGSLVGQFKPYQIRQSLFIRDLVQKDWKDWTAALSGQREVPLTIRGKTYTDAAGQPVMRPLGDYGARYLPFHRTAKWLSLLTLIGGPDALYPGLDDYLTEQGVKLPGLLPAIGIGVTQMMNFGFVNPGDFTRSLLWFAPGPTIGHIQDAASGALGREMGHGLEELFSGRELSVDERADRLLRGFIPVGGVLAARGRQALKRGHTPGEERKANTLLEAFGFEKATGPRVRASETGPLKTLVGLQSTDREREQRRREEMGDAARIRHEAVVEAADLLAGGHGAKASQRLREAERALGMPAGSLRITPEAKQAARERQRFTAEERQRRHLPRDLRRQFAPPPGRSGRDIPMPVHSFED